MKQFLWSGLFAAAAVATCVAIQMTVAAIRLTPRFPAFAGEDDFNLRLQYFLLIVCPAFAAFGAWIGSGYGRDRRTRGYMWLGLLAGSATAFLVVRLLARVIEALSTQDAANRGVLLMFLGWILLAGLGAFTAKIMAGRNE